MLYLIEILHQTTTKAKLPKYRPTLYLIEILHQTTTVQRIAHPCDSCILSKFYIKPQQSRSQYHLDRVVSYRNSTSNHNIESFRSLCHRVVSYRNSTSNHNTGDGFPVSSTLYLIEILHQTTTRRNVKRSSRCCILSKFYIKPQPMDDKEYLRNVVSYRNSTSNHNTKWCAPVTPPLYLIEILHQTTTTSRPCRNQRVLYLIEILHQTTTMSRLLGQF